MPSGWKKNWNSEFSHQLFSNNTPYIVFGSSSLNGAMPMETDSLKIWPFYFGGCSLTESHKSFTIWCPPTQATSDSQPTRDMLKSEQAEIKYLPVPIKNEKRKKPHLKCTYPAICSPSYSSSRHTISGWARVRPEFFYFLMRKVSSELALA